jgi:hypothetical protein
VRDYGSKGVEMRMEQLRDVGVFSMCNIKNIMSNTL